MPALGRPPAPQETIDRALFTLARYGDNAARAARELEMPERTLQDWRNIHRERYDQIRNERILEVEQGLVDDFRNNAILSAQLHRAATLQALEQAQDGRLKDPAKAAQNASIAAGVATDKLLVLTDRPSQITEHRDGEQILQSLAAKAGVVLNGTAEEIDDAQELTR